MAHFSFSEDSQYLPPPSSVYFSDYVIVISSILFFIDEYIPLSTVQSISAI